MMPMMSAAAPIDHADRELHGVGIDVVFDGIVVRVMIGHGFLGK